MKGVGTMILYLQALIQGIVEGLTEFLPVSSTGHMILVNEFLKMEEPFAHMFEIVIQLGAILSVVVYFRKKIFDGLFTFNFRSPAWRLWLKVLAAVIPALILGGIFGSMIQELLFNPIAVAVMLVIGGIALLFVDNPRVTGNDAVKIHEIDQLSYRQVLGIGTMQCLAMIPGTSRSAATIIGGMCFGCSRALAAEFSFFLAVPTMVAASAYSLLKDGAAVSGAQWGALGIGFVTAFLVAWGVIALFMAFIKKHDFKVFAWYRILLGVAVLIFFLLKD